MKPVSEQNLDGYGAPPIDWNRVKKRLDSGITQAPDTGGPNRHTAWLATVNPDGTPHVMPVGAMWIDDAFYFTSGPETRKSKNLDADPRSTLTVATHEFDLVLEGEATRVPDEEELQRVADVFGAGEWSPEVRHGAFYADFSAPSAGPPPWYVYRMTSNRIYALGTAEPYGATRWDF